MPGINYDECLLKHYVRRNGWLPLCQERRKIVQGGQPKNSIRRIRYFTFCAVGAVDVLMLDIAKIVTRSNSGRFDNVVFFDRTREDVDKTLKAIPGAIGFPGDFLKIVLLDDAQEDNVVEGSSPLETVAEEEDTRQTRESQITMAVRRDYIATFPFDVLNIDLEGFFFTPNDPIPGKMVKALQKIFAWQKRKGKDGQGKEVSVQSFSLMFTTQVGPPNLTEDYLGQLETCLKMNIAGNQGLRTAFAGRVGHELVEKLRGENFDLFFKLGMPKVLAAILKEAGWSIDREKGIALYEFSRPFDGGSYKMLHLMMQVNRQPVLLPGVIPATVEEAHMRVVEKLFQEEQINVTDDLVETIKSELQENLGRIRERRNRYLSAEY